MKRRPKAAAVAARPIEIVPHRLFLLIVRETPHVAPLPTSQPVDAADAAAVAPTVSRFPRTPGVDFVELEQTLLRPRGCELPLDAAHTVRFCRFINAMRRQHVELLAKPSPSATCGRPRRVHFVVRSLVRGDEAACVVLVVRWRLICLKLSPADALAPFEQLQSHFQRDFVDTAATLAGIAKGLAADLLWAPHDFESGEPVEGSNETVDSPFVSITKRFLLFATPVEQQPLVKALETLDPEQPPPTGDSDEASSTVCQSPDASSLGHSVAQLTPLLKQKQVAMVVKLNASPRYDDQLIVRSGIAHLDLSGAHDRGGIDRGVIARFLESCENAPPLGLVAVHSSTGRGRAALCIASYLVKHAQFTACEAIGWLRFCCPDAIPVWHAVELVKMQAALWRDGDEHRRRVAAGAQDETRGSSSSSPRRSARRLSLSLGAVDDDGLALSPRVASQISIGNISLGRDALLGTKVCPAQVVPVSRGAGCSFKELVAADATLTKQRPLTQGTASRRRVLDHHHHRAGADAGGTRDFATLHKFLHHSSSVATTPAPSTTSSAPSTTPPTRPLGGVAYSDSHVTPSRPAATAPDRICTASVPRPSSRPDLLAFD